MSARTVVFSRSATRLASRSMESGRSTVVFIWVNVSCDPYIWLNAPHDAGLDGWPISGGARLGRADAQIEGAVPLDIAQPSMSSGLGGPTVTIAAV